MLLTIIIDSQIIIQFLGINTGPVIAGVQSVGIKMPRYRVFGDTVKFAALLNATGNGKQFSTDAFIIQDAFLNFYSDFEIFYETKSVIIFFSVMKIHCSMETKILLDSVGSGSYFMEPRGLLIVDVGLQIVTEHETNILLAGI